MKFFDFSKLKENWFSYLSISLIGFLPFQFALNPADGFDLASIRLFILITFLFFLLTNFKKEYVSFKNPVSKYLSIFLILASFSIFNSTNFFWSTRKLAFLFSFFPLYLIFLHVFKSGARQKKLFIVFAYSSIALSVISLVQFFSQFIFGIDAVYQFLAKYTAPFFLGHSFAQTVLSYPSWLVASEGTTYMRAVGTFPDPHMLSYFLGLSLPWTVILAIQKKSRLLWIGSFLILFADIATFTRGAYLALIASAFIIMPLVNKEALKKILLSIAFVAVLFTLAPHSPVAGRLTSSFDTQEGSNVARLSNWQQAILIIKQNPLGVGIGMYALAVDPLADYRTPIYAHNLYLDIAAELGIATALTFIILLLKVFITFWKAAKHDYFFIAGVANITLFSVHSLVETPLYSVHILPIFFLILALAANIKSNEPIKS